MSKMETKVKKFKVSPHAIHKIMTGEIGLTENQKDEMSIMIARKADPKAKPLTQKMESDLLKLQYKNDNPRLPEGVITYLKEWYISKKYHRKKDFFSIKVDKGLAVEQTGVEMLSHYLYEEDKLKKNEQWFENEYMYGIPDVLIDSAVYDIKSAWNVFSFPFFETEVTKIEHEYQMHGYMSLTKAKESFLVHCLIDTPKPLIDIELKKLYYQSGGKAEDWNPAAYEELYKNYQFNDIPLEDRIKLFSVKRDESMIQEINKRVLLCRKYIAENLDKAK